MNPRDQKRTDKFLEELKEKCGGIDFIKDPPTPEERYECIKRCGGCLSLEEMAYNRRKMKKHGLKHG